MTDRHPILDFLLCADTRYAELLLGLISFIVGIWLCTVNAHQVFPLQKVTHHVPELWGIALIISGMLKIVGVFRSGMMLRKVSCLVASFVWIFLTCSFYQATLHSVMLIGIVTGLMAFYNAVIYIKLSVILKLRRTT